MMCAKSFLFLSHTEASLKYIPAGMGEIANSKKLKSLLTSHGYSVKGIFDIFSLFGGVHPTYESFALLNHNLASQDHDMISTPQVEESKKVYNAVMEQDADLLFILSWSWSLGALYATGIYEVKPTITKLYIHHANEKLLTKLYEPSHLLVTESLLANQKAIAYGIPSHKLLFLPHHYPQELETVSRDENYIDRLAQKQGKKIVKTDKTVVLGMVSRLHYGKNCEFALQVAKRLHDEGNDILLVLKGDLVEGPEHQEYHDWFKEQLGLLEEAPWFLWDREYVLGSQVYSEYAAFDLCLHLSGAEAGSNIIVEMMALGVPTVALFATTNPFLFQPGVLFVQTTDEMRMAQLPFHIPDKEDLYQKVKGLIQNATFRKSLGKLGQQVAQTRFTKEQALKRIPLLIEAAQGNFEGKTEFQNDLEALYQEDLRLYGLK